MVSARLGQGGVSIFQDQVACPNFCAGPGRTRTWAELLDVSVEHQGAVTVLAGPRGREGAG